MCKIISEFALEYRTTREKVLQQIEKKRVYRQRNRTRGKMITDCKRGPASTRTTTTKPPAANCVLTQEMEADVEQLNQILRGGASAARARRTRPVSTMVTTGATADNDDMMRTLLRDAAGGRSDARRRVRKPPVERRTLKTALTDGQRKSLGL